MTIIFVAGHAAATSNTQIMHQCLVQLLHLLRKHIAYISYMLDKHKHMTKKSKKTQKKGKKG